jgi:YD repeat-containing protein
MRRYILSGCAIALLIGSTAASASETLTYSYDARGRLKTVAHTGSVNNGKTTTYTLDKANNRTAKTTSP